MARESDGEVEQTHTSVADHPLASRELAFSLFRSFGLIGRGTTRDVSEATKGELALLGYLMNEGDHVAPGDLARRLSLSTSRIANTLNTLERKGYIERLMNPDDRRGILVIITRAGRKYATARFEEAIGDIQVLLGELGEPDASDLVRIARRIELMIAEREGVEPPSDGVIQPAG